MEGRLFIPRFNLEADISFLVDTGADASLIGPADGFEMGLDYSALGDISESLGIGGLAESYTEQASIAFTDPGNFVYVYHVDLEVAVPNDDIEEMPSLLGREIIDRWRMVYDPTNNTLSFLVRSADVVLAL